MDGDFDKNLKTKYDSLVCFFAAFLSLFLITLTHFLRHLNMENHTAEKVVILIAFIFYTAAATLPLLLSIKRLSLKTRTVKASLIINAILVALGVFHIVLEIVFLAR